MVPPLLVGTGVLLVSMLIHGVATALLVQGVVRMIRVGYPGLGFWKNVVVMMVVTLITAAMHLTEIALWAGILLACGEFSTFEQAFYVSAENYTALGYGDVLLSGRWRLLGPLEAINGLLLFGLSTAVLFAVLSHLIANRLRHQLGPRGETIPSPRHWGWKSGVMNFSPNTALSFGLFWSAAGRRIPNNPGPPSWRAAPQPRLLVGSLRW
jgi:hypothetical protein